MHGFKIYTGQVDSTKESVARCVVMELMEPYLGQNYHLFTDNFYFSSELFLDLLKSNAYATGTVRQNRKKMSCNIEG